MSWKDWVIVILVAFTAGWMLFDGTRALIVGDYVTPASGEYAGQLGPWSNLVKADGIEPLSTLMKLICWLIQQMRQQRPSNRQVAK